MSMRDGSRRGEAGQMTVELAVLLPVCLAVALIVANLMLFVEACAVFDRVARDAVLVEGVSPAGEQSVTNAVGEVEGSIERALGRESTCSVSVSASVVGAGAGVSPLLTTYRCTLEWHPWPQGLSIAGVPLGTPPSLRHDVELTVDRYRSGVVA